MHLEHSLPHYNYFFAHTKKEHHKSSSWQTSGIRKESGSNIGRMFSKVIQAHLISIASKEFAICHLSKINKSELFLHFTHIWKLAIYQTPLAKQNKYHTSRVCLYKSKNTCANKYAQGIFLKPSTCAKLTSLQTCQITDGTQQDWKCDKFKAVLYFACPFKS